MNADVVHKYPEIRSSRAANAKLANPELTVSGMGKKGQTCAFSPYIPPAAETTSQEEEK